MAYADAKQFDPAEIPVVDISALRDGSDIASVSAALHAASTQLGFIYIKGHGIADTLIQSARQCAMDFFQADDAIKAGVSISAQHRGWLAFGAATMQDDAKPDLKESFVWGYQDKFGNTPQDHALRGANQWPAAPPNMQALAMDYFQQAHDVAYHLMRGFALGLGLDETFFLKTCDRPLSRASFVYYPSQPDSLGKEQFGVGPHTDFGMLTILCQDNVGGLQVQNLEGEWVHAPPIEGTLLVNVGDLLSRWTDGAYKSTPHRVVNRSGKERLSLVLAFDPNPETPIDANEVFGATYHANNPPISCGDYLIWRFAKAFAYRKQEP